MSTSRHRRTARGILLRLIGCAMIGMVVVGVLVVLRQTAEKKESVQNSPLLKTSPSDRELDRQAVLNSVCLIASNGPTGVRTLGTGIVIGRDGQVLTCLHVMERATSATARFHNGNQTVILGYRAVWPQLDLAVVQLQNPEVFAGTLPDFSNEVLPRPPLVYAVGHPAGREFAITEGRFVQMLTTGQMISDVRRFAAAVTRGREDVQWIQHSTLLQEGYSGGPLFNDRGEILGINAWVNQSQVYAYAIANSEFRALLANVPITVQSLESFALPEVRRHAERWRISATQLQEVYEQCRAMQWQPATAEDYDILQQLAIGLTLAHDTGLMAASGPNEKNIEDLVKAGDKIIAALRKERWRSAGQLLLINEQAAVALTQRDVGFWGCVRIERVLRTKDESPRLLAKLSGFDESIVLELGETIKPPEVGEQWIIVGVVTSRTWRESAGTVPIITSYTMLPLDRS